MEGGIGMRFLLILLFYFIHTFIFSEEITQEIIKLRIVVRGHDYISYVVLSSKDIPNNFFIVGEKLW